MSSILTIILLAVIVYGIFKFIGKIIGTIALFFILMIIYSIATGGLLN